MPVQIMDCYGFEGSRLQHKALQIMIRLQLVIFFLIQIMIMAVVMKCLEFKHVKYHSVLKNDRFSYFIYFQSLYNTSTQIT